MKARIHGVRAFFIMFGLVFDYTFQKTCTWI